MTTTTNITRTGTTGPPSRPRPDPHAHRWLRTCLVAGAIVATAGVVFAAQDDDAERPAPARPGVTTAAHRYAAQLAELAEIAREQGLTGLSPLSLRPIDDEP